MAGDRGPRRRSAAAAWSASAPWSSCRRRWARGSRRSRPRRPRGRRPARRAPRRRSAPARRTSIAAIAQASGGRRRAAPARRPTSPVGALERLGGVEQQLVAAPGGLQLQADRQPVLAGRPAPRSPGSRSGWRGRRRARSPGRRSASPRELDQRRLQRRGDGGHGRPGEHVDLARRLDQPAPHQRPDPLGLTAAAAGSSIRYLVKPRLIGLSSGSRRLSRSGVDLAHPLDVGDQDRRQGRGRRSGERHLADLAAGLARSASIAASQASRDRRGRRLRRPGRGRRRSAGRRRRRPPAPRRTASSRAGARRRRRWQSGPETIIEVTAAMWWPSIAERPKVGFSPVSPQ